MDKSSKCTELSEELDLKKKLIEQNELREEHIDQVFKHKELQQQLVIAKLQRTTELRMKAEEKTVPAQEQGQQRAKGGGHSGMSSSHPNNRSILMARAEACSSGQKNFGGGLQTCPPFFMAGSSPPWGSDHPFSCREIAAAGAGLLTSPPSSWLAAALHGASATVFPAAKVRLRELVS
ncbi:UNVERIFIED_CONTAM: hypothetical protein FKN15_047460 [Acipenser sinensis]